MKTQTSYIAVAGCTKVEAIMTANRMSSFLSSGYRQINCTAVELPKASEQDEKNWGIEVTPSNEYVSSHDRATWTAFAQGYLQGLGITK